jgi:hypothetical protein
VRRYKRFLYLLQRNSRAKAPADMQQARQSGVFSREELIPVVDIALIWRCHLMRPSVYSSDFRASAVGGDEEQRSLPMSRTESDRGVTSREELLMELSTPVRKDLVSRWQGQRDADGVPFLDACCIWLWEDSGEERGWRALLNTKQLYGTTFGEPYVIAGECSRLTRIFFAASDSVATPGCAFSAPLCTLLPEHPRERGVSRTTSSAALSSTDVINPHTHVVSRGALKGDVLDNTVFQIVVDLVGPFDADQFLKDNIVRNCLFSFSMLEHPACRPST